MKITALKVIVCSPGRNFVTLRIETDEGLVGYGDAPFSRPSAPRSTEPGQPTSAQTRLKSSLTTPPRARSSTGCFCPSSTLTSLQSSGIRLQTIPGSSMSYLLKTQTCLAFEILVLFASVLKRKMSSFVVSWCLSYVSS